METVESFAQSEVALMKNVLWFEELDKNSLLEAGGKGANLGEMTKSGFPIPSGFVVTSGAYFKHLDHNNLRKIISDVLYDLDVNDTDKLNEASRRIKDIILTGEIPPDVREDVVHTYRDLCRKLGSEVFVAVRSSATAEDLPTASFAGQQSTFLNIQGEGDVVQAVKDCWASLFEPRAIFYRVQNNFDHMKVGLAAVVQHMVQSEKAGVMFSVNPITEDRDSLMIEAAFGLGEVVVSGQITPDTYIIDKKTMDINEKIIAAQPWMIVKVDGENKKVNIKEEAQKRQKISDSEIVKLAQIGINIEKHYGIPQDIEWAVEKGEMYIVQSRPITTLKEEILAEGEPVVSKEEVKGRSESKILVKGLGASPGMGVGKVKILESAKEISLMQKGEILVTDMTTPDFVPAMKRASAIVTNTGGMTSHAAIVSRELGIPCIVGAGNATSVLKNEMYISVDGSHGIVYEGKIAPAVKEEEEKPALAAAPYEVTGTKIYVNLAEVDLAEKVSKLPVDGVGLLRAEFMVADMGKHPRLFIEEGKREDFVNKLAENLRRFAAAFHPRPVVYRATDFKTNEYKNLPGGEKYEPDEANPMMGYRGAARYISGEDVEVFKMELEAIKKVKDEYHLSNLWLMIPFIRRVGELKAVKEIMRSVDLYRTRDFNLWIMVEVPSTVMLIDQFCDEGIDGVSIGTNDLTQLMLGIDRDNATLAKGFDERNEAVLRAVERVISVCNEKGVTVSLCGQAPSVYPVFAEKLVEFGITSMSVNPDAVERTRRIVAGAERKIMLKKLRDLSKK